MIAKQLVYDIKDLDPSIRYENYTFSKNDFDLIDYTELPEETPYIPVAFQDENEKWYKVTSMGKWAFYDCTSLTSINIPDSVTSIGKWAFGYCENITSIDIPNSVTSIGSFAFYDCTSLTSIEIPDSVTSIGYGAFEGCISLTSVTIGNSVTSISENAFRNCPSLTSITIPQHLEEKAKRGTYFDKHTKLIVRPSKSIADDVLENDVTTTGTTKNAPSRDDEAR